jgi:hypothetical protein
MHALAKLSFKKETTSANPEENINLLAKKNEYMDGGLPAF